MDSNGVIIAMILVCLALILLMVFAKPLKYILKFFLNAALGAFGLFLSNILLAPFGIITGMNALTLGFIGLLGLPGFTALLLISAFL